jgi:hypothetical protein
MTTEALVALLTPQFFANNGQFLSGGMLWSYQAGSATPAATFTDSTGLTQNTNPIILNARGECSCWVPANTAFKFILQDSLGNQIWSRDQVINAVLVTYYGVDTGSANNYLLTAATPYTTYQNGELVFFVPANTNTGPSTININGLGVIPITTITGGALTAGQIIAGIVTELIYFNGAFQFLSIGNVFGVGVGTFGAEIPLTAAATTDLGTTPNHNVAVNGTTTITSFGSNASTVAPIYIVRFTGSLTLTNSTSLQLPGNANIVTQAGDSLLAEYFGTGVWKVLAYFSATGTVNNSKIKPGDTSITSNATLTADPDLVSNALTVGRYSYELMLIFDSVAAGAGFKFQNTGSAVDSRGISPVLETGYVNAAAVGPKQNTFYSAPISYPTVSTATDGNQVVYKGSLLISTPGTVAISWAQATSTASATTLRAGSYLTLNLLNTGTSASQTTRIYTTAGAGLETIPTGYNTLTIEVWGGGGGGGLRYINGSIISGGGGGGGGGYSRTTVSVTGLGGDTINYLVGAVGVAATNAGGASTVSSGTLSLTTITANGGGLGGNASSGTVAGTGAAGGTATGGTVVNTTGNAGSAGQTNSGGQAGGGGGFGISGIYDGGGAGGKGGGFPLASAQNGGGGIVVFNYSV